MDHSTDSISAFQGESSSTPGLLPAIPAPKNRDVDYIFYELTRSLCSQCRRVIDAQILLRDNKVYMRKRCPEHGSFEVLVYGDAQAYTANARVLTNPALSLWPTRLRLCKAVRMIAAFVPITSSMPVWASLR